VHADQLPISSETVRALIAAQLPQWAGQPVRRVQAEGTVNAVFRIGDELAARFPLRPGDPQVVAAQFKAEASAARKLFSGVTFPTPQPVALGAPGEGFPLPWAVQTWLAGTTATDADPSDSLIFAHDLAALIHQIRGLDTEGRSFTGSGRGGNLADHDDWVQECLTKSEGLLDVVVWREEWERFRELPRQRPDVMNHSDLIPGNILVSPGSLGLAGVLDVGGLGPADPALDLVSAWHLLGPGTRAVLRRELGDDDLTWERGRAWAFEQAIGLVWYYRSSNPAMSRLGRRTLERLSFS
jgi:aminoglycoside phosphotransferase (APT) family kinase protein